MVETFVLNNGTFVLPCLKKSDQTNRTKAREVERFVSGDHWSSNRHHRRLWQIAQCSLAMRPSVMIESNHIRGDELINNWCNLVPPFWITEPRDVSVLAGQPAAVHCQADGYPSPNVTWLRNSDSGKSLFTRVFSMNLCARIYATYSAGPVSEPPANRATSG